MNKGTGRQHKVEPMMRISAIQLDRLLSTLNVEFVRLTECLVSPGWRIRLGGTSAPGIHYNLSGHGRMVLEGHPAIELSPHTLVIMPSDRYFHIEVPPKDPESRVSKEVDGRWKSFSPSEIRRFVAGEDGPQLMLICGYFQASYCTSVNLFSTLTVPIVEQFDSADRLDGALRQALDELLSQEIGDGAMAAAQAKPASPTTKPPNTEHWGKQARPMPQRCRRMEQSSSCITECVLLSAVASVIRISYMTSLKITLC